MARFPFHGEQLNGPPFQHHPEDIGGLPMPDMPQVLATEAFQQGILIQCMALRQQVLHCLS